MRKFIAILYGKLSVVLTPSTNYQCRRTSKKQKNTHQMAKKNLSCKWMFFPILTIDIVEEIASGIETEYRQTFDT